ncbi:hypothetical protein Tco_1517401, partial [Tanacetum coccineum]
MSSITAQQAKLDLELVPREKRLKIRKGNRRLNPGKTQREPTFQVVLDALALTPCYSAFLTTTDVEEGMYYKKNVDYVELLWEDFIYQINNRGVTPPKKTRQFKKPAFPKLATVPASPKEPTKKSKRVKRPAKKSTNAPTTCDASLLKEAQIKKTLMKSKQETHKLQASGSSGGTDFELEGDSDDGNESDDNDNEGSKNNDDSGNGTYDSERTDSNEEEN